MVREFGHAETLNNLWYLEKSKHEKSPSPIADVCRRRSFHDNFRYSLICEHRYRHTESVKQQQLVPIEHVGLADNRRTISNDARNPTGWKILAVSVFADLVFGSFSLRRLGTCRHRAR